MPEYSQEQTKPTNGNPQQPPQPNQQPQEHPRQPIEIQPDGTWILGRGADRWIPSRNQIGDLRWIVERDLRKELGVPPATALNKDKIEFHKRQLALLDLAKQAPRCEHVFSDGRCCKAPRVKKGKLCYAHTLMEEKRPQEWNLPPLEDANAVMLWLMDALRGLLEGRISEKTAGLMFYGLQLAMVNARFTTFRDVNFEEMVRKAPKLGTRTKPQRTRRNTKEDFTAEGAENAEEGKGKKASASKAGEGMEPQEAEVNPGVESAKSIFSGVETGEGVADNCPVPPPSEPPRKSSQNEVLMVPKEVEHHLRR